MTGDKYSFCFVLFFFEVEDKVKDQLEAANPEPIIEEVVSAPFCLNRIFFGIVFIYLFSFLRIWPTSPQENQTGGTFLKITFQPVQCLKYW